MIGQFEIGGRTFRIDFARGTCLAIALDFAGAQPSHFGAAPARAEPMSAGTFLGDTRRGGSCNVPILTLNPHCNGTHTESVSHIVDELVPVHEVVSDQPIPASLITVTPADALTSGESYSPKLEAGDSLITAAALNNVLRDRTDPWLKAVVIRTLPNNESKRTRQYGRNSLPPFLSIEAVDYLDARGVQHLLIDVPSVDKTRDEGRLTVHHRFWNVPEDSHTLSAESRRDRTITEMIYVPDALVDGIYLLELQIPAFQTDVAPSRPWLFPVETAEVV